MDMGITVPKGIKSRTSFEVKALSATITCLFANTAIADWNLVPELETKVSVYNKQYVFRDSVDNEVLSIVPKLSGTFDGVNHDFGFTLQHTNIVSNDTNLAKNRNFDSYRLNSQNSYFAKSLNLKLSATRDFQAQNRADSLSFELFDNSESFAKRDLSSAQLGFRLPNPRYIRFESSVLASKSRTTQLEGESLYNGYNSDTLGGSIVLASGKKIHAVNWLLSANRNKTDRENYQDFDSTVLNGKVSFPFFSRTLRLVVVGQQEDNKIGSADNQFFNNYDQSSYGGGLEWFLSDKRYFTVTYNRSEKTLNDQKQDFIGIDSKWAFSERNNLAASYNKRFYGDAYSFSFEHVGRMLNINAVYNEDITSESRMNLNTTSTVLVCPQGVTDIGNCFQPTPGYELQPGEQGFNLNQYVPDLVEEVYLRKNANIALSWKNRKLTVGLNLNKGSIDYLETNRKQDNQMATATASWEMNRNTKLNISSNYAEYQFETQDEPDITQTVSLGLSRKLGRNISTRWELRYLDRESPIENRSFIDKRLTASLIIKY
ncbi:TIGR03016 family PEP-CTERM system-associated outer membrane protein [Neptunicella marina]|uniref:TIGR03016 family PEP-CTERM system-associated outer membrane protein n=1 Tax=Neptunicella marina TaxID=2125989 RepID=A0A8J6ITV9_9ALTE|nr:TIGR03016 family PEP-CTERM system-associated outer membrane protein [Neptunicella marina]MBC3765750.1 TIGR03016 family PEP-CTERM system-associated outer membrane protein [Neptunicella marina]